MEALGRKCVDLKGELQDSSMRDDHLPRLSVDICTLVYPVYPAHRSRQSLSNSFLFRYTTPFNQDQGSWSSLLGTRHTIVVAHTANGDRHFHRQLQRFFLKAILITSSEVPTIR